MIKFPKLKYLIKVQRRFIQIQTLKLDPEDVTSIIDPRRAWAECEARVR